MQMYPGWSARDNYAVHKKRKRKTKKQAQPEETVTTDQEKGKKSFSLLSLSCVSPSVLASFPGR